VFIYFGLVCTCVFLRHALEGLHQKGVSFYQSDS
jgi:hypothetical protein